MSSYVYDEKENRWRSDREIELENIKNKIIDELLNQLINNYYIEFTITLPTGQTITVKASLKKKS